MLAVHKNSKDLASPRRWSQSAGSLPTAQLGFKLGHPIPGCQNKAGPTNMVFRARALKQGPSLGARTNSVNGKLEKRVKFHRETKAPFAQVRSLSLLCFLSLWAVLPRPFSHSSSCWKPLDWLQPLPQQRQVLPPPMLRSGWTSAEVLPPQPDLS